MASNTRSQRKRKSAGLADVFEVNERDLSPEPDPSEPKAKVLKNSDVSEAGSDISHNLDNDGKISENAKTVAQITDNTSTSNTQVGVIDISDVSESIKDDLSVVEGTSPKNTQTTFNTQDGSGIEAPIKVEETNVVILSSVLAEQLDEGLETVPVENHEEIFTILDEEESREDDVIMICDSSVDATKETNKPSSPQIFNDNPLEDGEVNDNALEEPDASEAISDPAITIKFANPEIAELYKYRFFKFIQSFVELQVKNVDDTTVCVFRDSSLNPKEWVVLDDTLLIENQHEELAQVLPETPLVGTPKKRKKKKKQEQKLFVVDTNPDNTGNKSVQTKYSAKFLINDEQSKENKDEKSRPSSVCFNCSEEHCLKDCPHPKNYARINANRQKFQTKNKATRYHLEEDQKYSHFAAGKISSNLKKALGLKKHQIPCYVYQMRKLGYPPGWLEEAKFVTSDLAMFDIDGKDVKNKNVKKISGLDLEKIVDYPGFNVPPEKDAKDEYKYYHAPPFSDQFSKENMIEHFNKYLQREEDDFEAQDMDLDNASDSCIDKVEEESTSKQISSPDELCESLQELQRQKDLLLEEIKQSSEIIPWDPVLADDSSQSKEEEEELKTEQKEEESERTETTLEIKISEGNETSESSSPSVNCVKHSVFGTPILKSNSPFNKLPNPDNFTKGVSPVIDFENLPNSTGKYEQMTDVLQKVRNTLKYLQNPKS